MLTTIALLVGCAEGEAPSAAPATPTVAATVTYVPRYTAQEVEALFLDRQLCVRDRCWTVGEFLRWYHDIGGGYYQVIVQPPHWEDEYLIFVHADCAYDPRLFADSDEAGCKQGAIIYFRERTGIFTSDMPYGNFLLGR